jgi:hypothetical protein
VGRRKWAGGGVGGLKEKVGRRERKKKERGRRVAGLGREERVWEVFFFFKPFQTHFSNFKFKLFSKHFNPVQNFQNILKTFKNSHK